MKWNWSYFWLQQTMKNWNYFLLRPTIMNSNYSLLRQMRMKISSELNCSMKTMMCCWSTNCFLSQQTTKKILFQQNCWKQTTMNYSSLHLGQQSLSLLSQVFHLRTLSSWMRDQTMFLRIENTSHALSMRQYPP